MCIAVGEIIVLFESMPCPLVLYVLSCLEWFVKMKHNYPECSLYLVVKHEAALATGSF